jgi:hypothetical protein
MGAETYDERELAHAQTLIGELLETHWERIQGTVIRADDSTASVSINLKLDHGGPTREVKVKLSYSVKTSDEAEAVVRNPAQKELPL